MALSDSICELGRLQQRTRRRVALGVALLAIAAAVWHLSSRPQGAGGSARAIVVATAAGQERGGATAPALDTLAAAGEAVRCASAASALLPSQLRVNYGAVTTVAARGARRDTVPLFSVVPGPACVARHRAGGRPNDEAADAAAAAADADPLAFPRLKASDCAERWALVGRRVMGEDMLRLRRAAATGTHLAIAAQAALDDALRPDDFVLVLEEDAAWNPALDLGHGDAARALATAVTAARRHNASFVYLGVGWDATGGVKTGALSVSEDVALDGGVTLRATTEVSGLLSHAYMLTKRRAEELWYGEAFVDGRCPCYWSAPWMPDWGLLGGCACEADASLKAAFAGRQASGTPVHNMFIGLVANSGRVEQLVQQAPHQEALVSGNKVRARTTAKQGNKGLSAALQTSLAARKAAARREAVRWEANNAG